MKQLLKQMLIRQLGDRLERLAHRLRDKFHQNQRDFFIHTGMAPRNPEFWEWAMLALSRDIYNFLEMEWDGRVERRKRMDFLTGLDLPDDCSPEAFGIHRLDWETLNEMAKLRREQRPDTAWNRFSEALRKRFAGFVRPRLRRLADNLVKKAEKSRHVYWRFARLSLASEIYFVLGDEDSFGDEGDFGGDFPLYPRGPAPCIVTF